ncbi:F0F1 ATP synthase subunit B [Candidatus Gottesmanbacteria bacterium]|nr:F0F1 ATP synthase subunit B [Candidatus Gottesmanbacteria bacterium]
MEKLGIEPLQLATQVFNFVIMVAVLTYFLYKPILRMLKERRDKIAQGLEYTEKMKQEVEKTEAKRLAIINAAKEEGRAIVEESKKAGKLVEADIIEKAHEEARAIVEKGKADVEMERINMEKKLKDQMVSVAGAIAAKALESALSVKVQRSLIDKKIRSLAKQLS